MKRERILKFRQKKFNPMPDTQWQIIEPLLKNANPRGRKMKHSLRHIMDCILMVCRTGIQWRNIDEEKYPPYGTVFYHFQKMRDNGTFSEIMALLNMVYRFRILGRKAVPSIASIDSQSVKAVPLTSQDVGIDGNKKVNGRKRHIVVDSQGQALAVHVTSANCHDGKEGVELLPALDRYKLSLKKIFADSAYKGTFEDAASICGFEVEISQKPESQQGFVPQKERWQVERSFAWLNFYRRLSKDYEKTTASARAFIELAFISRVLSYF